MDLEALEVFAHVMRRGSLSAVARERAVAPSSVSRLIAGLEASLGTRLFQRSTRRIAPTETALLFLTRIEPHLAGIRDAREALSDTAGSVSGVLRVTASTSFGIERLSPLLAEFAELHPRLVLELSLTDRVVDLIAERFDLAIRHGPLQDSTLAARRLLPTRYHVVASPAYAKKHGRPKRPADLAACRCLTFPLPGFANFWRFRNDAGRTEDTPVAGSVVVNSGLVLRRLALDGAGIVLLSDWLVAEDLRKRRLLDLFPRHRVTPSHFDTAISAVFPSRTLVPTKVRAFVEFLRARL